MDRRGQVAMEYMLIFFIVLIILSTISVPLVTDEINNVNDVASSVKAKNMLVNIAGTVNMVYSSDYGSMRTISVDCPIKSRVYYKSISNKHYIYTYVLLSDNSTKEMRVQVPCKVSFNNNPSYYYSYLNKRWYYNTEVKWINSSKGYDSVNVYFK